MASYVNYRIRFKSTSVFKIITVQFKYFNSHGNVEPDTVDVLICDESHRIREYSWSCFTPKHKRTNKLQIEELINAPKVCVFFIDDLNG